MENNQYTDYLLENFNIKVVVDWTAASGNDYTQKVGGFASPAIRCLMQMTVSREYMLKAARSGQLYDITDLFPADAVTSSEGGNGIYGWRGKSKKPVWMAGSMQFQQLEVETAGIQVINIRQDWLDECGLEAPKTLDDVENIAKYLRKRSLQARIQYRLPVLIKIPTVIQLSRKQRLLQAVSDAVFSANDCYPGIF